MQNTGQMGAEMEARVGISMLADLLVNFAAKLGAGSEIGSTALKAAQTLTKAVPPGSVPPGAQQALMQKLLMAGRQNQANVAAMRQMPGGAAAGGGQAGVTPPPIPRPPSSPQMFGAGGGAPPAA